MQELQADLLRAAAEEEKARGLSPGPVAPAHRTEQGQAENSVIY